MYDSVGFYYSFLRKTLSEMKGPRVQVENLGSFSVISKKLPEIIAKTTEYLNSLESPETFNRMTLRNEVQEKLERALSLEQMIKDEEQRRKEFIAEKNERDKKDHK